MEKKIEALGAVIVMAVVFSGCSIMKSSTKTDILNKLGEAKVKVTDIRSAACSEEVGQKINEIETILGLVAGSF